MIRSTLFLILLVAGVSAISFTTPQGVCAQTRLDQPTATFPEDFGAIQTVRELPDGRVLVADPLGGSLYLVDLNSGQRTVVGREGQGPQEYRQPDAVWPLPGGSTLLVDLGNGRLTVLGPDLEFGATSPIAVGEPQMGQPLVVALPQGVDGQGRVYARAMGGVNMGEEYPDSANVLRIDRDTGSAENAASFKIQSVTQETSGGANNRNVSISPIPLSPEDAWGVAPDGSVILARSSDYHVEIVAPDGSTSRGPVVPFESVRIRTAEKEEYIAAQGRAGGGLSIRMMATNGQMTMGFSRGGGGRDEQTINDYTWPEEKPPFYSGRISVDQTGRAWIRRHVEAGEASTYDVFNNSGSRIGTVLLEHGKRVIGFGEGTIYVVSFDQFDLNYLERYDMVSF